MRDAACKFWELDENQYVLVLPNMHEIMSLNFDEQHMVHKLSKYFEL